MKQTAVEWLIEQFGTFEFMYCDRSRIIKIAKEMEQKQIEDTFIAGVDKESINGKNFEQYYNETFKNK